MLATTGAVLYLASASAVGRVFLLAWSRAQEGRPGAPRERLPARLLRAAAVPLPRVTGLVFVKDVTVFFRDPSQWSQLLLLVALVVVYVFNFSALPLDDSPMAITVREVVAFGNLGLASFVTAAVAVRFVYPTISLEGRAWWVLRAAPVKLSSLWWSKFWLAFLPLAALGELLTILTNRALGVGREETLIFMATLLLVVAAIVSLGLAFGAAYPRFDTHNAAQIATGFGGVLYMVSCLAMIAVVAALELWPVSRLFWRRLAGVPLAGGETAGVVAAFVAVALVTGTTVAVARRVALRKLARLEH
jgi:ABC-2 type transport system permease protein